ncbi:MAG TPA: hypothetical protein VFQ66_04120 [Candidatus Limnocylindria bacterium]|nr:hypothetical protein [Candidatus Limnocylindria bacterium]
MRPPATNKTKRSKIVERVPIETPANATNRAYLNTKRDKMGHLLSVLSEETS